MAVCAGLSQGHRQTSCRTHDLATIGGVSADRNSSFPVRVANEERLRVCATRAPRVDGDGSEGDHDIHKLFFAREMMKVCQNLLKTNLQAASRQRRRQVAARCDHFR